MCTLRWALSVLVIVMPLYSLSSTAEDADEDAKDHAPITCTTNFSKAVQYVQDAFGVTLKNGSVLGQVDYTGPHAAPNLGIRLQFSVNSDGSVLVTGWEKLAVLGWQSQSSSPKVCKGYHGIILRDQNGDVTIIKPPGQNRLLALKPDNTIQAYQGAEIGR